MKGPRPSLWRVSRWQAAVAILGLVAPVATLAFGWSYASVRETRFKELKLDERDRASAATHFRWEMIGLGGLLAVLTGAGVVAWQTFRRTEQLARERAMFVSAVSHELRTPLTTLRMHAEMLSEGLVAEERKARVYSELVSETARLTRLVENVLEASRLGEGRRAVRLVQGDLCDAALSAVASMQRTIEAHGFTVEITDSAPVTASLDPAALEIIVHNLLDNVLKYAADHEPRRARVTVSQEGSEAVLRVRDHGPGIPQAERERVFERFYRVDDERTAHRPGTGLGLALVRELAFAHGGTASLAATQGQGTTVEVRFPLAPGAAK